MGEELQTGLRYEGPKKLTSPVLSVSFELPERWSAEFLTPEGPLSVMAEDDGAEILMEGNATMVADPISLLSWQKKLYGLTLRSYSGIEQVSASVYRRRYGVQEPARYSDAMIYLVVGSQDRGVVLNGFFNDEMRAKTLHALMAMATSISYAPLRALPRHGDLALALGNAHFVFYEQVGNISEKREIWLCRNRKVRLVSVHSALMNNQRVTLSKKGHWHFDDPTLTLVLNDDSNQTFQIGRYRKTVTFDGHRTFRLPNVLCRKMR